MSKHSQESVPDPTDPTDPADLRVPSFEQVSYFDFDDRPVEQIRVVIVDDWEDDW